ncbi:LysR family transcriptional regulator [Alkalihalobacillus oceani]|uniref:LysR family transcriptional regulator n=1 Tax=Halalkalibacter oceani TaxID=1653776 RepID=UPI00203FAA02|nr:LysR family transcriptional regulator [Halalkalibacter oceani]MCM3762080.1 LysR family transcriptional regulator [Halalkalibacter oceani]
MELTDLRIMLAVQQEGGITKAAEKLGYVQSNITMRIRKLEAELGVPLFHRDRKGVTPTEKGLLLCRYASDIMRMADEAVNAVKEPDYPSGELTIGVVETIASSRLFIEGLSRFQRAYPQVSLSLRTGTSPENYERVLNGEVDGAFLTGNYDLSALEVAYELQEEVQMFTAKDEKKSLTAPDLAGSAWVVFPEGCPLRAFNEDWLRTEGATSGNIIEVSNLDTMLNCVKAGIGSTLLTQSAVDMKDDLLRAHRVPERYRFVTSRLVTRKSEFHSKAYTAFAECITAAAMT